VSDFALTVVSAVALVLTFVVTTSILVVMMGESRRLPTPFRVLGTRTNMRVFVGRV